MSQGGAKSECLEISKSEGKAANAGEATLFQAG